VQARPVVTEKEWKNSKFRGIHASMRQDGGENASLATGVSAVTRILRLAERVGPLSTVEKNFTKSQFFLIEQGLAFIIVIFLI
jgi:hypothetical protein